MQLLNVPIAYGHLLSHMPMHGGCSFPASMLSLHLLFMQLFSISYFL